MDAGAGSDNNRALQQRFGAQCGARSHAGGCGYLFTPDSTVVLLPGVASACWGLPRPLLCGVTLQCDVAGRNCGVSREVRLAAQLAEGIRRHRLYNRGENISEVSQHQSPKSSVPAAGGKMPKGLSPASR